MAEPIAVIRITQPVSTEGGCYAPGELAGFPPDRAVEFLRHGHGTLEDDRWTVEVDAEGAPILVPAAKAPDGPPAHKMVEQAARKSR